ncbi:MAG: glycosyltransferase family 39 protein [Candidatus Aminicenantes bacterium]|nr:glycosyltransferase family 39 protein [Candidatus Aminicenantes bacterium]
MDDVSNGTRIRDQREKLLRYAVIVSLGVISLLVLLVRLKNLGALSLWMDEGFYYLAAERILEHGYPLYPSGHVLFKGILYSYLLAAFAAPFGLNEFSLRLFSVLTSVAALPVMYLLARKFLSRGLAFLGVVILALSTWETEYARAVLYFAPLQLVYAAGLLWFIKGYFEDRRKYRTLAAVLFVLAPHVHQLGMGLWFCFPALFLVRGARRFFKKDVLLPFSLVTLTYVLVQVHEALFWKVGYVYEKSVGSLAESVRYFFTGFSLDYFKEILKSFPAMGVLAFLGAALILGETVLRQKNPPEDERGFQRRYFLALCFLLPLVFFGFFRTHVQPRYLFQLRPVLILLYLTALWRVASIVSLLALRPFFPNAGRDKTLRALSCGLLAAGFLAFTDQAGPGEVRSVVNRKYGDRIATDIITRSGRLEHYDHKGVGSYVRTFLREDDRVVAMHMVFQHIYAGRTDYWLWSGGPGTWDAWEKTPGGWKDFYVGARWINSLEGLKTVLRENASRRVWLIASPSLQRRDHISREIADFIKANEDKRVFRGRDGMSEVFLWHDRAGDLTGPGRLLEAEWLPVSGGDVVYPEDASKHCALSLDKIRDRNLETATELRGPFRPGPYNFVLRARIASVESPPSQERLLGISVLSSGDGTVLRSVWARAADFAPAGRFRDFSFRFFLPRESGLTLKIVYRGETDVWLDGFDLLPVEEGP